MCQQGSAWRQPGPAKLLYLWHTTTYDDTQQWVKVQDHLQDAGRVGKITTIDQQKLLNIDLCTTEVLPLISSKTLVGVHSGGRWESNSFLINSLVVVVNHKNWWQALQPRCIDAEPAKDDTLPLSWGLSIIYHPWFESNFQFLGNGTLRTIVVDHV